MATTQVTLGFPTGTKIFAETALGASAITLVGAAGVIYMIDIDNTLNAAQDNYLKIYDSNGVVTVGTTVPDHVIRIRQGQRRPIAIPEGLTMVNGIQVACLTTGGTAGTTPPTSSVPVKIIYTS